MMGEALTQKVRPWEGERKRTTIIQFPSFSLIFLSISYPTSAMFLNLSLPLWNQITPWKQGAWSEAPKEGSMLFPLPETMLPCCLPGWGPLMPHGSVTPLQEASLKARLGVISVVITRQLPHWFLVFIFLQNLKVYIDRDCDFFAVMTLHPVQCLEDRRFPTDFG